MASGTDASPSRRAAARKLNSPLLITMSRMVVLGLGLVTAPVLARTLGPGDRGDYAALVAVLAITPVVAGLGVPMALRRRAALGRDPDATYRTIYRWAPSVVVLAVVVGALIASTLFHHLDRVEQWLLVMCTGVGSLFVYVLCVQSILMVEHRFRGIAVLQGAQGLITSIGILVLWAAGAMSVMALEILFVVATSTAIVCALLQRVSPTPRGRAARALPLLRESIAYLGTQIADTATPAAPVIVVFALLDSTQAGYFSVAMTISSVPVAVAYAIGSAVYRGAAVATDSERPATVIRAVRSAVICAIVVCGSIMCVTPLGLPILFGRSFEAAVPAALVMTLGAGFALVSYVCMQVLAASGRAGVMTVWQVAGLAVSLVGIAVLGPALEVTGAGLAVLAGGAITAIGSATAAGAGWRVMLVRTEDLRATVSLLVRGTIVPAVR
ncbi:MAG: lipopolysaccharide biosynthesis protein [Gordonia paraffinivorans]